MGAPLTPVSSHDAKIAAANMLEGNTLKPNYAGVPSVAFTVPPIAAVGLSEAQARKQGLKFRAKSQKASDWYTARRVRGPTFGVKEFEEERSERELGVYFVGAAAGVGFIIFALASPAPFRAVTFWATKIALSV